MAQTLQHRQAAQFTGLSAASTGGSYPQNTDLGTGGYYAVKCVTEPGTKNQSGQGNTVIDALRFTTEKLKSQPSREFDHDILLTAHRRENFGQPLLEIFDAILDLCREFPAIKLLYPVHPNPNVRGVAMQKLGNHAQIKIVDPLDYPDLVAAMQRASIILTDSGGIQQEAPALAKPVLVLRTATERPEAVELGVAKIVGPIRNEIVLQTRRLLLDNAHYEQMARGGSPYGDGHAAESIRGIVREYLNL